MLADGRLHVSGIAKLVPHLTDANCAEVPARATRKSKREIEELVAEIAPRPDVPTAVRKLPRPGGSNAASELGPDRVTALLTSSAPATELGPDRVPILRPPAPPLLARPIELGPDRVAWAAPIPSRPAEVQVATPLRAGVTSLSPARYKVQFTASAELRDQLERLQALTGDDLATAIATAVTERLVRLESKRFGVTSAPRKRLDDADTRPSSRYLPAPVRRIVRERDGSRCAFVNRNGTRCTERRRLEFHHRHPYGRGGAHSPANVCLMCRAHNAYLAELDYGKERMERYRRRPDRVSEDSPVYGARTSRLVCRLLLRLGDDRELPGRCRGHVGRVRDEGGAGNLLRRRKNSRRSLAEGAADIRVHRQPNGRARPEDHGSTRIDAQRRRRGVVGGRTAEAEEALYADGDGHRVEVRAGEERIDTSPGDHTGYGEHVLGEGRRERAVDDTAKRGRCDQAKPEREREKEKGPVSHGEFLLLGGRRAPAVISAANVAQRPARRRARREKGTTDPFHFLFVWKIPGIIHTCSNGSCCPGSKPRPVASSSWARDRSASRRCSARCGRTWL
jgi:hypothetical protein